MSETTSTTTDMTTSASTIVDAPPRLVFDFIRRPANHPQISGDGSVKEMTKGPEVLEAGSRFGMKMQMGAPYRVGSKVVEFEENRLIGWAHFGKHVWRWELEPVGEDQTRVTETFDLSPSPFKALVKAVMKVPAAHEKNVRRSVENVRDHFAS